MINLSDDLSTKEFKSVVYICGSGRSGSTLLDIMLNSSNEVSSLGEFHRLGIYLTEGEACSCEKKIYTCEFWKPVLDEIRKNSESDYKQLLSSRDSMAMTDNEYGLLKSYMERFALITLSPKWFQRVAEKIFIDNYRKIELSYRVFESISKSIGTPLILDSTKDARRMKYLYLIEPKKTKFIYLVRDGRAVTAAAMVRKQISMGQAVKDWVIMYRKMYLVLKNIPSEQVMLLRYEDLCNNTDEVLTEASKFIGMSSALEVNSVDKDAYHGIGGNPMRFRRDESRILLDEKWRNLLTSADLATFENRAGKINRQLGYV